MRLSFSVAIVVVITACGVEPLGEAPPAPGTAEQPSLAALPATSLPVASLQTEPRATRVDLLTPPGLDLAVTHSTAPDGTRVRLVAGMMACGFAKIGEGEGTVVAGALTTRLTLDRATVGSGYSRNSVWLWFDLDADGACGAADQVVQVPLPSEPSATPLTIDLSQVQPPASGACWLFHQTP